MGIQEPEQLQASVWPNPSNARIDHQRVAVGALQMQHAALAVAGQHFRQGLPGFGTLHGGVQFKQFAPDELVATTQASSGCRIEVAYATFEVQDEHQIRDGLKQAFQVLKPGGHSRTRQQALPEPLELAGQTAQHRDGRPQQHGRVTGAADRCWTDAHPGVTQGYGQKTAHFSRAADLFLENNRLMILTGRSERKLQRPSAECRSCRNSGQSRILTRTVPESARLRVSGRRPVLSVSLVSLIHSLQLQAVRLKPTAPEDCPRKHGPGCRFYSVAL